MNPIKRIGFLGGTFDPFHFGHINLGLELQERHALDEIIVCPAANSPHKVGQPPLILAEQRFQMAKLAVEEIPGWRVIDWELRRGGTSYTIDTIRALHEEAETNKEKIELYLLLGEDVLEKFAEWKEIEQLLVLARPLVGVRGKGKIPVGLPLFIEKNCQQGMTPTCVFEISSTLVRNRLKKRLYCGHLVPAKVLDFIYQHQLYF